MAGRKTKASTKRPAYKPKRRVMRKRAGNVVEWASAKQTLKLADDDMNIILQFNQIRLEQFDRLVNIAQNYQFFRFTKIEMKFKPYSDTYIPGTTTVTTASIPYFFYLIDKGNVLEVSTFDNLRDAGCKPIRFDDKTINVNWKPCVLTYAQDFQSQVPPATTNALPVMKRTSPWLATSQNAGQRTGGWIASQVDHTGILYGCEQNAVLPDFTYKYGVEITVHAQFKKPLNAPGSNAVSIVQVKEFPEKAPPAV